MIEPKLTIVETNFSLVQALTVLADVTVLLLDKKPTAAVGRRAIKTLLLPMAAFTSRETRLSGE